MPSIFFFLSSLVVDPSYQGACLLIVACIVVPGVASAKSQDLIELDSLSKFDTNAYHPVLALSVDSHIYLT